MAKSEKFDKLADDEREVLIEKIDTNPDRKYMAELSPNATLVFAVVRGQEQYETVLRETKKFASSRNLATTVEDFESVYSRLDLITNPYTREILGGIMKPYESRGAYCIMINNPTIGMLHWLNDHGAIDTIAIAETPKQATDRAFDDAAGEHRKRAADRARWN